MLHTHHSNRIAACRSLFKVLANELYLWFQIVKYDLAASTIPAVIFTLAVWYTYSGIWTELPLTFLKGLVYFSFYIFTFCLSNQLAGVDEDRLNKPDRPFVRQMITHRGGRIRLIVSMLLYTAIGAWFGILWWTLLWQVVTILHNRFGWAKHWFTKNLAMFLGTLAQLAAAWELTIPLNAEGWRWVLTIALGVFFLVGLQDLRDVAGDKKSDRLTLPIAYGMLPVRIALAIGFTAQVFVVHKLLVVPAGLSISNWLCDFVLGVSSLHIAYRILLHHTPKADHDTYMLYNYWYCLVLACAFVLL
ncbi:MAG: UbiA family prenyltransferase [Anaerolineae bacterium]|nr:UbiA family prenyltransferase [Anaerolineae bacterium]